MSKAIENLQAAQTRGMAARPAVRGFPYLAEALRQAGATRNEWTLPARQALFITNLGPVVSTMTPLESTFTDVPTFDRDALIRALRDDQEGRTVFPRFLEDAWRAGVVRYEVDFVARKVSYFGCLGEVYIEDYPAVDLPASTPGT